MRKLATVAVAMTLCLSLMGLGYAWWSENLHVAGTVNTGNLDWKFVTASVNDWSVGLDPLGDKTNNPAFTMPGRTGKDVAQGEATISADRNTVTFTLHNAYPGYLNSLETTVENVGTIPLRFDKVLIKDHGGATIATIAAPPPPPYPIVNLNLAGDARADVALLWGDNLNEVLCTAPLSRITNSFKILVLAGAPESSSLRFSLELVGVQYNAP